MKRKSYYISLGAGANQKPLIEAAKARGYDVIGVDQNLNAEAFNLCDIRLEESIFNYRKIHYKLSLQAIDAEISGGYAASYGQALYSWAVIAERFKLPGIPRTLTETLLDKTTVRQMLHKSKVEHALFAQPEFIAVEGPLHKSQLEDLEFPLILKPRHGAGKNLIHEFNRFTDAKSFLTKKNLQDLGLKPSDILIEERVNGDEITVVGIIENFRFHLISITDKVTSEQPPFIELEHRYPSMYHERSREISDMHQAMNKILQIESAPLVSEWKIRNGRYHLIELSPQIPGEYIGRFIIPKAIGYDFFDNLISLTTGEPIVEPVQQRKPVKASVVYFAKRPTQKEWDEKGKNAFFAHVLNEKPGDPPAGNHDRFGVMGFLG